MDNQQDLAGHDLTDSLFICDICGQNDLNDMEMKMHMASTHGDDVICLFCDLKGITPDEMTLHINSVHFGDNLPMSENMEVEQSYDGYALLKENEDYVFSDTKVALSFRKESEMKMSTDELNTKAACIEEYVDSGVSSNKCCCCKEEATTSKAEGKESGVLSSTSSLSSFVWNTGQLRNSNIVNNESNFTPVTEIESNLLCSYCEFVTDDGNAFESHFIADHTDQFLAGKASRETFESDHSNRTTTCLLCPICGLIFPEYSQLHFHVNGHFSQDLQTTECAEHIGTKQTENRVQMIKYNQQPEGVRNSAADQRPLNCSVTTDCSISSSKQVGNENSVSCKLVASSSLDSDDRSSTTEGVIQKLLSHYNKSPHGDIRQFWLCSNTDHLSAGADKGWGCGYRNFQMLLSCLTKCSIYKTEGLNIIPSLRKIQSLLEDAWRRGFDQTGSTHFQGTVLNTKKWIGATEVATLLSSLRIRCSLVDFHTPTGSNNTHPLLFQWIKHYFQTPDPFKLPLYFQHQGHSRTIIGIEEHHDGSLKLLTFDPGVPHTTMKKYLQMDSIMPLLKCLRRSVTDLKHKQYQIVTVQGIMDKSEMEECKILKSTRIP